MTGKDRNKELFDALLKVAVSEALKNEMDTLPTNEELNMAYKPSPELDKRFKNLIIQGKIKSKIKFFVKSVYKIAACIIMIFVLSSITLLSVEATRNVIFNAFVEWFGKYTEIQFQDSVIDNDQKNIYRPAYLPNGFKETSSQTYGNTVMQIYSDESGDEIIFKQRPADAGTALIDNENTIYTEVEISGNTAYLFKALTKEDYSVLLWQSEGVVFEMTSQISSNELIRIGNSLKK